jgi:GNAT superfamily N-acetyltransferase
MSVNLVGNQRLADLLAERVPAGLEIRRAAPSDDQLIAAFLAVHWPTWQTEVSVAMACQPATLFLALEEGGLLGFSAYECNNVGTSWFGPMGTAPEARGRGIGRLLLAHCLRSMAELGFTQATIPWVAPTEFYAQAVGAEISRKFVRVRKLIG